MSLFSQRKGITSLSKVIQKESLDEELKNCLWNVLTIIIWNKWEQKDRITNRKNIYTVFVEKIVNDIWINYFKFPLDQKPNFYEINKDSSLTLIRRFFYKANWWEIYDLIEFIMKILPEDWKDSYSTVLNRILQQENSAYRMIGEEIVEITDDNEINSIENALDIQVSTTKDHLNRALELLSDKKMPDYRNSIKESISSVESYCQIITKNDKATLGDCIKILKNHQILHPSFEQALNKLYGYTSDANGIRHALNEEETELNYSDAKFMLVVCSAFINYLNTKTSELKIPF